MFQGFTGLRELSTHGSQPTGNRWAGNATMELASPINPLHFLETGDLDLEPGRQTMLDMTDDTLPHDPSTG